MAMLNSARRILLQSASASKTNPYRKLFTGTSCGRIQNPAQNNSFGFLVRPKSPAVAPAPRFSGMNNPTRSMCTKSMGALAVNNGGSVGALAIFPFLYKGIQEIMADYVHHEMTRNLIMLYFRLFLIVAAKDVFVSLVF